MKADFEKGTKICCSCKKELPLDMFYKDKISSDGLAYCCKKCRIERVKSCQSSNKGKEKRKAYRDKTQNTFGRIGCKRGNNGMLKRDYELNKQQLQIRNERRERLGRIKHKGKGVLKWYSGELEELNTVEYRKRMIREYNRQRYCAIRGYIGRKQPSEHFLFDFDLEKMLEDNVYINAYGNKRQYITKWWKGEIRHWTVKDGIWKE